MGVRLLRKSSPKGRDFLVAFAVVLVICAAVAVLLALSRLWAQ